jgi:WD40 repeat protein
MGILPYSASDAGVVVIWDARTGREIRRWTHPCGVRDVAYSRDGSTLAVAEYTHRELENPLLGQSSLWDVKTGKRVQNFGAPGGEGRFAYSPDGKTLAVDGVCSLVLFDPVTGKEVTPGVGHRDEIIGVHFLDRGRTILSAGRDDTVRFWDIDSAIEMRRLSASISTWVSFCTFACAPSKAVMAAVGRDEAVRIWDTGTGKEIQCWPKASNRTDSVTYSPDGRLLALGGNDGVIRIREAANGRERCRVNNRQGGRIDWVGLSRDGKSVAGRCFGDQSLHVWNIADGREVVNLRGIAFADYSPDGETMAILTRDKIHICEVASGKFMRQLEVPKTALSAVTFSPDGRLLITGEWPARGFASYIRLWEVATGQEILKFSGHRGGVRTVSFSADGHLAASGGADTSIVVWNVLTPELKSRGHLSDATLSQLWTELASADAARAYRAVGTLASAPSEAVNLFSRQLRPATPPDNTRINSLLHQLDDDRFEVRERATKELSGLRDIAESMLRKVLDEAHPSTEARSRLERLLNAPLSPDALRGVRGIQALEMAGTAESKALLERLATGIPEARLTREAKVSAARLARLPVNPSAVGP